MSDVPPLTSGSDSESDNSDSVDNVANSPGFDTNKNSSNSSTKEDICQMQEARTIDENHVALGRQHSDSLSDASGEDDDDDDDNNTNDNVDVIDDTESEEDLHKADNASQLLLPKETATQHSQQSQQTTNSNSSSNKRRKSMPDEDKLQSCLQQATLAYFNKNYLSSVSEFKIALMMVAEKKMHKNTETWVIKYCLGLSLINLKLVKEIHDGERVFQSLIEDDKPAICILGYLGLAKAYLKQNRFVDAIGPLQEGLRLISDGFCPPTCCHWPGTLIVIEETNDSPGILKNLFDSLLSECRNPPLPLAVCRYSGCLDPFKTQIYLSDPEFKGYIQVACFEKCLVEFHRDCWRELKATQLDKRSDKELVNGPCVTPDCNSIVCKISIFGCDGNILKTMTVEEVPIKSRKAGQKHKTVSVMHGKAAHQKKSGKKAKGGLVEEKGRADEGTGLAENRSRSGETSHVRDDLKPAEVKPTDGAKAAKVTHRRKSLEFNEDQEQVHPSRKKGTEPAVTDDDHLVTMQRTDFVALQKKKNEEQDLDWLSKKPKKKRDKERQKKTVHLDEFVEKIETEDGDDPPDEAYFDANDYGHQFWEIPPFVNADSREDAWIRPPANQAYFSDCLSAEAPTSNGGVWSVSGADAKPDKAAGDATISKLTADKGSNNEEMLAPTKNSADDATTSEKMPLETAEDTKGNIMSYFEMLLEKLGPCLPDDESILRELEAFSLDAQVMISEVGGISKLLLQSLKFTQVNGYICLLKDAAKARQKARQRRLESAEGKTCAKRFGQSLGKPDVQAVAAEGKNTGSFAPVSSAPVSVPVVSTAVSSKENKVASSLVAVTPSTSAGVSSGKADRKGGNDGLFGLCDLNEYKEILRAKNMSLQGGRLGLEGKAADDDSNLSVIEKFKKEVHKAACKDRNLSKESIRVTPSPVPASSTEVPVSVNTFVPIYSKSSAFDSDKNTMGSKAMGNGTVNSVAATASLSYNDTKGEIRNDGKTTTGYLLDIYKNPPTMVSNLLDIVDEEEGDRKAGAFRSLADDLDFEFLPVAKLPNVDTARGDFITDSGSMVKSTLSATASEFHFQKFPSSFKSEGVSNQSTTVPNMTMARGNMVATYALYEPSLSPCAYSMNSSPTAMSSYNGAVSGMRRCQAPTPPSPELVGGVNVTGFRADCGYEHKGTNTDQAFSFDDYNRLKCEHADLQQRCNSFADRLQRMKTKHMEELLISKDKLDNAEKKSVLLEKEKKNLEEEMEKLRSELIFAKTSLQSANHLVDVTDRLLNETQNALQSEQEQRRCLHEKYENLLCQLQRNIRGDSNKPEVSQATTVAKTTVASVAKATVASVDQSSKAGKKTKPSFDKIINILSAMFPNLSKIELSRCVQAVRMRRNNSLSGLTVHEIVAYVKEFVHAEHAEKWLKKSAVDLPFGVPNSGKQNNVTNGTTYGAELFEEEVDPCIICHEELNKDSASMLDCGHSFHTECVRKWFREQSTCPTCRNHALLPDEFPVLGRPPLFH